MLELRLSFRLGVIATVSVEGAPPRVAALLVGATPRAALEILGRLYSVCGRAQRAAASLALASAGATPFAADERAASARDVVLEAVQEHLWRLLIDWPRQLGLGEEREAFRHWYRAADPARGELSSGALKAVLEREWLGLPLEALARLDLEATGAWAAVNAAPLARVFAALLARACPAPRDPSMAGGLAPREAGAIARLGRRPWIAALASAPLAARVAARIVDLGRLLDALVEGEALCEACGFASASANPGRGRGEVDVARGRLCHEVELDAGCIRAYEISVPTEAHFAPAGGAYGWHLRREHPSHAAAALEAGKLWALALDPCVPYRVSLAGAGYA